MSKTKHEEEAAAQVGGLAGTKLTLKEFMRDCMDITKWMHDARQPFLGYISKGVYDRHIRPLVRRNRQSQMDGRLHDIAWMSSCCLNWGSSASEVRARVRTDKVLPFPASVRIGGRNVDLRRVYNDRDFEGGWIACLIMLPEEAARFEIGEPERTNCESEL